VIMVIIVRMRNAKPNGRGQMQCELCIVFNCVDHRTREIVLEQDYKKRAATKSKNNPNEGSRPAAPFAPPALL